MISTTEALDDMAEKELVGAIREMRELADLAKRISEHLASLDEPWGDVFWWSKHTQGFAHLGKEIERGLTRAWMLHNAAGVASQIAKAEVEEESRHP